jgi:hypothetical protein
MFFDITCHENEKPVLNIPVQAFFFYDSAKNYGIFPELRVYLRSF